MIKKILIAAFVDKNNNEQFLDEMKVEFDINRNNIYTFINLDDNTQHLHTFYIELEIGERINLREYFKNALIVHKKKHTFYTINALNKLIEKDFDLEKGNVDYKKWNVDWNKYKDKLIVNSKGKLVIVNLKRVFY